MSKAPVNISLMVDAALEQNEIIVLDVATLRRDFVWQLLPNGTRILTFRGEAVLEVYPIEFSFEEKEGYRMVATRRYRILDKKERLHDQST